MSSPTLSLGLRRLRTCMFMLMAGGLSCHGPAVYAQTLITNTANANLRSTPNGPFQTVQSNNTTVPLLAERLEIVKVGDRGAAEPGDTVVYRLLVKNSGNSTLNNLVVADRLPLGLQYVNNSSRAALSTAGSPNTSVPLSGTTAAAPTANGQVVTFTYPSLAPQQTLTIVYAALLTPAAVRGSGQNLAVASAFTPSGGAVNSNQASHLLKIRPGILSDCGTIIGRVFVDKNFDGEQQPGEPGVPNAVIFTDDGNRIVTDANGLFSLAYAIAGYRTGTLDSTSLPGYILAPNRYRIEGNSPSRMVKLAPGGMARMNFAVTPSFREGQR